MPVTPARSEPVPPTDATPLDRVSHGYAPDGPAASPPQVPLDVIVRDVIGNLSATAKAELALIEARGALAGHGAKWASAWGFVAACALLVAMLALAFGAILILAIRIGPFLATLVVFAVLLALAGFAGWRAKLSVNDIKAAFRNDLLVKGDE